MPRPPDFFAPMGADMGLVVAISVSMRVVPLVKTDFQLMKAFCRKSRLGLEAKNRAKAAYLKLLLHCPRALPHAGCCLLREGVDQGVDVARNRHCRLRHIGRAIGYGRTVARLALRSIAALLRKLLLRGLLTHAGLA